MNTHDSKKNKGSTLILINLVERDPRLFYPKLCNDFGK